MQSTEPSSERFDAIFESVLDLTDHVIQLRKTPLGGAVERVLVLVFQLGSFIAYVSRITSDEEEAC